MKTWKVKLHSESIRNKAALDVSCVVEHSASDIVELQVTSVGLMTHVVLLDKKIFSKCLNFNNKLSLCYLKKKSPVRQQN